MARDDRDPYGGLTVYNPGLPSFYTDKVGLAGALKTRLNTYVDALKASQETSAGWH